MINKNSKIYIAGHNGLVGRPIREFIHVNDVAESIIVTLKAS